MFDEKINESMGGAGAVRSVNERVKPRLQVSGSGQVRRPNQQILAGKLYDLSVTGASVFLDLQLPLKEICTLRLQIFRHGSSYTVEVQGQITNTMLVGSRGFRHGFQFLSIDSLTQKTLNAICA